MSDFRFRLEAVRKLRQRSEDECAGDLADAMSDAGEAQEAVEQVEAVERASREKLQQLGGGVAHLKAVQVMLDQLGHHHDEALEKQREAEFVVREKQEEFVQAVTDRKAIDRLKERREKSWRLDMSRQEQKSLDEVLATRHVREGDRGDPE